ncbi:protein O-linked-mannose beta-1,4-N-acetylglucosaminyltransferase 2-like [Apostichopus japonicus]|uniref:protein O-linked-mannose beta-1,4-N-acetylglucosaminyltransferase 2-like n=1 Tax=Stichopus japonicus TaxID=307972 RepID=UPI003AB13E10
MHVIHDDLLPSFETMTRLDGMQTDPTRTLILMEAVPDQGITKENQLYQLLSKNQVISDYEFLLEPSNSLTCFEDAMVGLSRDTIWYQYGIGDEPEGPIPDSNLTSVHIDNFTNYMKKRLNIQEKCNLEEDKYGVLISRKRSRRVLNEDELVEVISKTFKLDVVLISLEDNSVKDLIKLISCAKFMIGVHGALMILSMFLPTSSLILELFPFALRPEAYTPYNTLSVLSGRDLEYLSWRNMNRSRTVTFPKNDEYKGGITHLSQEDRERIINSDEVPPHLCCYDPEFRFRLNQDTEVDIPDIVNILNHSHLFKRLKK